MENEHHLDSSDDQELTTWERINLFLGSNRHLVWTVMIAAGLTLFWILIPARIQHALLRSLRAQSDLASMLFFFGLLALSLLWSLGQKIDAWVFSIFNMRGRRPRWLDYLMLGLTQLGNGAAALIMGISAYLSDSRRLAYELILGTLSLWWLVELMKAIIRRSRPFVLLSEVRIVGWRERGRSFPSGHTSQVFFLVTLTVQHFKLAPEIAFALYGIAGLVAVTRMYVGAHYPRDVLAGAILGAVWGLLGILVDQNFFLAR